MKKNRLLVVGFAAFVLPLALLAQPYGISLRIATALETAWIALGGAVAVTGTGAYDLSLRAALAAEGIATALEGGFASAITNLDDVFLSDPVLDQDVLIYYYPEGAEGGYWTNAAQATGAGTGDFLADGTVAMTGDFNGGGNDATNIVNAEITGTLDGGGTAIGTNFAAIYSDELNVTTLNLTGPIDGVNLTNAPNVKATNLTVITGLTLPNGSVAESAVHADIARDSEVTANTNLLHLNVGTLTLTNRFSPWTQVTLDGTNAVLDIGSYTNFYWSTTTSNYLIFSNITAGAQGSILIYTPDSGGEQINFSSSINNLSTNRYAPVFTSSNQTWIAYSVTFGTDETNVTVGISVK